MLRKNCTAFLLLTAMLASLAACGGEGAAVDTTAASGGDTTAETATDRPASGLPEADFNGESFTFLNGNTAEWMTTYVVTAEEENGDTVNDAIYKRNGVVEDKYNVVIEEISTKSVRADVTAAIASGDTSFDVALMVSADANTITLEGGALDYSAIPHVNVENDWWIEGSVKDFSIGNRVYFAISQFDTTHYDGVRTFFFNKNLADKYNLESPYQLVRDGKWTLDKFLELGMKVAQDLNGDSQWGAGDQFGYTSYNNIGGQTLMTGVGVFPSLGKDKDDHLMVTMSSEENINKLITLTDMLAKNDGFLNPGGENSNSGGVADFTGGRVMFYNETLSNIGQLRDMKDDFGIIPAPKWNEAQPEYYSLGGNPYFMLVPITSPDLEKTGLLMEALAYDSMGIIDVAFYDTFLSVKVTRDEESPKMLDIIFSNLTYYHPVARSYFTSNITSRLWTGDTGYASYFASNEAAIAGLIEEAEAAYEANVK